MEFNLEIYDENNNYCTKDGQVYTREMFLKDYPAVEFETMAVTLVGRTIIKAESFSYLRGMNGVKASESDENALMIIKNKQYTVYTESTTDERIASALEFIAMMMLPEVEH